MGSQVPSPTHVSKSQHGGKVPTFEPRETTKLWLIVVRIGFLIFYAKVFTGLVLRVGSCFLLAQLSIQVPSLTFTKSCHVCTHVILGTWDSGLGASCGKW